MIKKFLIRYFPFLGKYKRFLKAIQHSIQNIDTYSQHKEDIFFIDYIKKNNLSITNYIYVDVGANHPTDISNTFLLYKNGMKGIIVEPNQELINLFKFFRKKDILFNIGVGNVTSMLNFFVSKTPVISSFIDSWGDSDISDNYFVPVMLLDDALRNIEQKPIFLLSIDVEGMNTEALEGAKETFSKSLLVCIEWDDLNEKEKYSKILGSNFNPIIDLGCNTIFENKNFNKIA